MSSNLLKKSVSVGALIALGSSALLAAPAQAEGAVVVSPSEGTTFNSIIGSPVSLTAEFDERTYSEDELAEGYWVIENPSGAELEISTVTDITSSVATDRYLVFDADGVASQVTGRTDITDVEVDATGGIDYKTKKTKIAILGGYDDNGGTDYDSAAITDITIDTTGTKTVSLSAYFLVDNSNGADATTGLYNASGFDRLSNTASITIYAPSAVSASVALAGARGADDLTATVVFSGGVNSSFVKDTSGVVFFKDGTELAVDNSDDNAGTAIADGVDGITEAVVSGSTGRTISTSKNNVAWKVYTNTGSDLAEGLYSARAVYTGSSPDVYVGAASPALDLSDGSDSFVDGATASVARNANTQTDSTTNVADVDLRTGTKSVTIDVQANSGSAKREAAGIKVRAEVEGVTVSSGNDVTVTAAAGTIDARGDKITAFAFTNSKGVASFTINAAAGTKGDALTVDLAVLDSDGVYVASGNGQITVDWEDAALSTFTASPASFVSGDPVNVTFTAKDQFGAGIDSTSTGALSVYAEAIVGGIAAPATYNETKATVDGAASFSFANFAGEGTPQQLKATLRQGNTDIDSNPAPITVNVYDTFETSDITVADEYTTDITYVDFVEGDTDVASVNAAVKAAGLDSATGATMTGTVLDANNAGQPGAAVTVAADGVLFKNGTVYSEDSITFFANEFGSFTVNAYAHTASSTGIDVTVSTEGFSTTTTLKTYLPASIGDENLSFSWTVPEVVVMNTTYAITAKLTDKWGNPIAAKDTTPSDLTNGDFGVSFQGTGAVEINSVGTAVQKDLGTNGTATVFLRSIKDIAGPGAVSVTLGNGWTYAQGDGTTSTSGTIASSISTDDTATAWDETTWSSTLSKDVEVLETAPAQTSTQKVNAGSFKGYVAVYALGYEGQRLSAKIGKDWVIVDPIVNNESANLARVTDFTGAGVDIAVRIYIDRVLLATIPLTTK